MLKPGIEFVQKPFTAELLARNVRAVLDRTTDNGAPAAFNI
jgi:DNA-binding response OmpR family regulator